MGSRESGSGRSGAGRGAPSAASEPHQAPLRVADRAKGGWGDASAASRCVCGRPGFEIRDSRFEIRDSGFARAAVGRVDVDRGELPPPASRSPEAPWRPILHAREGRLVRDAATSDSWIASLRSQQRGWCSVAAGACSRIPNLESRPLPIPSQPVSTPNIAQMQPRSHISFSALDTLRGFEPWTAACTRSAGCCCRSR